MSGKVKGKVKWYNRKDGYGFIVPDDGGKDVFFHKNQAQKSGIDLEALKEGDPVAYTVREYRGKNQAEELALAS